MGILLRIKVYPSISFQIQGVQYVSLKALNLLITAKLSIDLNWLSFLPGNYQKQGNTYNLGSPFYFIY